ncbi:UDP-glucosyltransferase 2-like [Euwallacea fornicatus]|uniref:UDP-glucosyltransferase 2-like n=1 Tax=Euwallacea fornicatus TaxID=995702 RepID=UPI00338FEB2A
MNLRAFLGCLIFILALVSRAKGANILGVFPVSGKSVNILYNKLMKGLADAGHNVTVISAHNNKLPVLNGTYRDVVLTGFIEDYDKMVDSFLADEEQLGQESFTLWESLMYNDLFLPIYNKTLHHPNVRALLKSNQTFDLVIMEHLWSESIMAFPAYYNCPSVMFTSMGGINPWVNEIVGNHMPISYVPHTWMIGDFTGGMSLYQRFQNLVTYLFDAIIIHYFEIPAQDQIVKLAFPDKSIPSLAQMFHTPSLLLLGTHSSLRQAAPLVPNVIEIGGFHIDPPKKLPKELQEFFDNAEQGVIYFSMGSHIRSANFSTKRMKLFLNVFSKLDLKVLWKFEEELPGKPPNVLIKKWVPQTDVLAHPNLKLFITHAGHGSILETIHRGKPALMLPVFVDQFNNAFQSVAKGFALQLPYADKNFTEEVLLSMIREMITNPIYTENAKTISRIYHDRPMKPLETAVYWIEYIIRNKGADHLKVASIKLPWYKLYMVDVLLFVSVTVIVAIYAIAYVIGYIVNLCKFNRNIKMKEH